MSEPKWNPMSQSYDRPSSLAEFLLARIAEDEERGRVARVVTYRPWVLYAAPRSMPADLLITGHRVLAECAAKRKLIELADDASGLDVDVDGEFRIGLRDQVVEPYLGDLMLRALAEPYADHPEYRPEWKL